MNSHLTQLHPYPFEKLALLKQGITPAADKSPIALSIGEPQHPTPHFIQEALIQHLHGLSAYPSTKGLPELRQAIARWLMHRFGLPAAAVDAEQHVLPVNGSREALFSFVQAVVDPAEQALVLMPNPFYQIYEGAALLAGARPYYLNTTAETGFLPDFDAVPEAVWRRCKVLFICSPGNPTGAVLPAAQHRKLLALAERYDFIIASDECYTELYFDENAPPPGLLGSAYQAGNTDFRRCVSFQSLSKRSNAPGLRSGFVAGDPGILRQYLKYRTYHGCAMPLPTQHASIAAWRDEAHVRHNRDLYRAKFAAVLNILRDACEVEQPAAGFYLWLRTRGNRGLNLSGEEFAQHLLGRKNITVLPGGYLSRDNDGINPGADYVRMALVAPLNECVAAAERLKTFINSFN